MTAHTRLGYCLLLACIPVGCGGGSVGADDCIGMNVRCELPQPTKYPYTRVVEHSMGALQEDITATWVRALPLPQGSDPRRVLFTSDLEGDLWLFASLDDHLVAARLDADGEIIESADISAPSQLPSAQPTVTPHRQTAIGPTLQVQWEVPSADGQQTPVVREWLRFGATLDASITRLVVETDGPFDGRQLAWAADGALYVLSAEGRYLDKYDSELKLLWRQAAFRGLVDWEMPLVFGLFDETKPVLFSTRFDAGGVSTAVHVLDEHGNFSASGSIDSPQLSLAADNDHFPGAAIMNGPSVVSSDSAGKLVMLHVQPQPFAYWGVTLQRGGDHSDTPPTATDRAGTLYAAPLVSGANIAETRHAICRMPLGYDATSCFVVEHTAETERTLENANPLELAVDGDGVAYLRYGDRLMRVDLPAAP